MSVATHPTVLDSIALGWLMGRADGLRAQRWAELVDAGAGRLHQRPGLAHVRRGRSAGRLHLTADLRRILWAALDADAHPQRHPNRHPNAHGQRHADGQQHADEHAHPDAHGQQHADRQRNAAERGRDPVMIGPDSVSDAGAS